MQSWLAFAVQGQFRSRMQAQQASSCCKHSVVEVRRPSLREAGEKVAAKALGEGSAQQDTLCMEVEHH